MDVYKELIEVIVKMKKVGGGGGRVRSVVGSWSGGSKVGGSRWWVMWCKCI